MQFDSKALPKEAGRRHFFAPPKSSLAIDTMTSTHFLSIFLCHHPNLPCDHYTWVPVIILPALSSLSQYKCSLHFYPLFFLRTNAPCTFIPCSSCVQLLPALLFPVLHAYNCSLHFYSLFFQRTRAPCTFIPCSSCVTLLPALLFLVLPAHN
jgi:hypothetical protein